MPSHKKRPANAEAETKPKRPFRSASHLFSGVLTALVPHFCPLCSACSDCYLCDNCITSLGMINTACSRCALPLNNIDAYAENRATVSPKILTKLVCSECIKTPPLFSHTVCAFEYRNAVVRAIQNFKDGGDIRVGAAMASALKASIETHYALTPLPELIIPTPIHWRRRLQRGFNQSELIAKRLSKAFNIPYARPLKKQVFTASQKNLTRAQRQRNLSKSFSIKEKTVKNKHIVIVDDIITTGSTIRTLSELCVLAGASKVDIWALARTPKP